MRSATALITLTALVGLPLVASADARPSRKSGLWETTVTMDQGIPPQTMKECVDEATDAEMMKMATDTSKSMGGTCSKNEFKKTASGFETESDCSMGGSSIVSKGSFSGDFTTSYKGEVTATMKPAPFGNGTSKTTITAKYLGACTAGMQPGDVIMGNGMKMNMKTAAAQAEKMANMNGADIAKAMAAAQAEIDPEDLKAMQEAMKEMGSMGK
jgi:hypothetical protein